MEKYLTKSTDTKEKVITKKQGLKRKYKEDYIEYGFISLGSEDSPLPFYLICNAALSNEALVPSKLKRHLETKHPTLKDEPKEYLKNLMSQHNKQAEKLKNYMKLP